MHDIEYQDRAEALLRIVERTIDRINDETDADIDAQRVGAMVTLVFADKSQIIINLQKPLHEVWMAAKSGGYHYKWQGNAWLEARGGGEFFSDLSRNATVQSGLSLQFCA